MSVLIDDSLAVSRFNAAMSPWAKSQGRAGWLRHLELEVKELKDELNNPDRFVEELGDVLHNTISLAVEVERTGGPTVEQLFAQVEQKIRARKPWLFKGDIPKTAKEEESMYQVQKKNHP